MLKAKCATMILGIFLLSTAGSGNAQDNGANGTKISTNPRGATVEIAGEYTLIGRAPYTILQPLAGPYRIKATLRGYEDYTADHLFRPGSSERLSIRLTRKTRLRSAVRSLFFPGWGQFYADQKWKGLFIGAIELGSLGYLLIADSNYQNAVDAYNRALDNFNLNGKNAELHDILLANLNAAQAKADDKYEIRRRSIIFAASVYVYNVLDALIFFPSFKSVGYDVNVATSSDSQSLQLSISKKF